MIRKDAKRRQILLDYFPLIFDGYSFVLPHYLVVLTFWPCSLANNGYIYALMSFKMYLDEGNLSFASHKERLDEVLQFYGKEFSKVSCIIGDNFSANLCLTGIVDCHFIGFACQRLHLGIKSILERHNNVLCMIQSLMVHLKVRKPRSKFF